MSAQDDAEILAAARAGFLDEARELLQQFEAALLVMEEDPGNAENLNAAFRAAHTIKGTAGLFGCEAVAAFTHEVETLMDGLRAGTLSVSDDISAALLDSSDQMGALLAEVNLEVGSAEVAERSRVLGRRLRALHRGESDDAEATPAASMSARAPTATATATSASTPACWHVSLRFGTDALRNGLDPLAFVRYLGSVARVIAVRTLVDDVPSLEQLDPEACCLGLELSVDTLDHPATDRAVLEQVFEFAADDAEITILEPRSAAARWDDLLTERSRGDDARRRALFTIWLDMGLSLPLRAPGGPPPALDEADGSDSAPVTLVTPVAAAPLPLIERRSPPAAVADRRQAEPERRDGSKDRRNGDETRFVRVRADKLDHLIDIIGELVIAGSGAQTAALRERSPLFTEAAQRVCDLVEEARDGALALRMVPIGETFARFHRVVRDVSKQLGKDVELTVSGGDTELDKAMVETIADPLTHLVRNSLDHGIESPADREAAGKLARGRLGLHAYHEGGSVVIEVSDDGRGLARERILAKAVQRELVSADATLSDAEVWQLIFLPGFSTAEVVTSVSGRGVGMDVVKRNIESLRGQISIASIAGQGTTMQIRLPLTLAIIDGFLTQVGRVHFVLPLAVVGECIDLPSECTTASAAGRPGMTGTFNLRGEVLPWLDLAAYYGAAVQRSDGTADTAATTGGRRSLIIVRSGPQRLGLVVDRLLGEHQTVIKPLAGIFRHLKSLAGSTILGSGEVALVLDMPGLFASAVADTATHKGRPSRKPGSASMVAASVERASS
jgi:two-component system, chemotaxis family, sensor kinase CheA